eukprot:11028893-Heterocapsa_arctica.AAC.1
MFSTLESETKIRQRSPGGCADKPPQGEKHASTGSDWRRRRSARRGPRQRVGEGDGPAGLLPYDHEARKDPSVTH